MEFVELFGWAGSAATLAAYAMKTMLPLRIAAIVSNIFFLIYSTSLGLWPMVILDLVLLPFNIWRTVQILQLRKRLSTARASDPPDFSVLTSYNRPTRFDAGTAIFNRGDAPEALYYIASGEVTLEELGVTLGAGDILGEIAFFIDAKERTATARCTTDAMIHVIEEKTFLRLYFQDPAFGMAIMKTITRRLIDGVERRPEVFRHRYGDAGPAAPVQ